MIIETEQDMIKYWEELATNHKILLLEWDLWAGKTTLTRWFVRWLGIDDRKVQSPTYAYLNIYDQKVLHIDMYRLEKYEELVEKWILEEIQQHDYIIIERPKWIDRLKSEKHINKYSYIKIKKISPTSREILIKTN